MPKAVNEELRRFPVEGWGWDILDLLFWGVEWFVLLLGRMHFAQRGQYLYVTKNPGKGVTEKFDQGRKRGEKDGAAG